MQQTMKRVVTKVLVLLLAIHFNSSIGRGIYTNQVLKQCSIKGKTTESDHHPNSTTNPNPNPYLVAVWYSSLAPLKILGKHLSQSWVEKIISG